MDLQIKKGQTFGMWTCEPHVTGVHLIDISVCHRQHGQQQTSSLISLIFSRCRPIFSYLNFHSPNSAWPLIICLLPNLLICLTFWLPLPLPAFTCPLPLSAGRTGEQQDLLPEFDLEIMPGTVPTLHVCLSAWHFPAFLLPPDVSNSNWPDKTLFD